MLGDPKNLWFQQVFGTRWLSFTTRIVFIKDNQRCGAILQHEMKKIAVLIFAPPPPRGFFLLDGGTYVKFRYIFLGSTIVIR